jgi:hypothetical protein
MLPHRNWYRKNLKSLTLRSLLSHLNSSREQLLVFAPSATNNPQSLLPSPTTDTPIPIGFCHKEMIMKRLFRFTLPVLCAALGSVGVCSAQSNSYFCNNSLILGVYGFTLEGTKLGGLGPTGPQVGVAMTQFKADGTLSQIDAVVIGGVEVSDFTHPVATGTYSVNPNCTGTFTIDFTDGRPSVTTYFVVVDNGNEIDTVVKGVPPGMPGVIATRSIGKRRFSFR